MAKKSREISFFLGKSGVLNKVLYGEALQKNNKNHNVSSTFSQAWNASVSPFEPFYPRKWQISLPFYIPQLVKSLPFHIPEAWKRYPVRPEPPHIVKPLIVSNSPPPGTKLPLPELRMNIIIIINLYFGLNWAHVIVGFHMTSLKFKLKNYRFYRDFTFTMH